MTRSLLKGAVFAASISLAGTAHASGYGSNAAQPGGYGSGGYGSGGYGSGVYGSGGYGSESTQMASNGSAAAHAKILGVDNKEIGFASFEQGPHGVMIHIRVTGLEPGKKGVHLHSHGLCEHHEGFKTARGHIGLKEGGHGLMNPDGPEEGDLPNIFIGADGIGEAEMFTTMVNIGAGGVGDLLDEDGSTLMIHQNADDHISQPIGGSGPRVACGVIVKK